MRLFIPLLLLASLFFNCSKDDSNVEENENTVDTSVDPDDKNEVGDDTGQGNDNDNDNADQNDGNDNNDGNDSEDEAVELNEEQLRLVDEFKFRAFKKSRAYPNEYIRKWNSKIKVQLSGSYTSNEIEIIESFLNELKSINNDLDIGLVSNTSDANVEIYYSSAEDYIKNNPNFISGFTPEGAYPSGYSNVFYGTASQEINTGKIWIETQNEQFVKTVKREILYVLGLGNSKDETSILSSVYNTISELNHDDVFVVKTLYNTLIKPGFDETDVDEAIKNSVSSFF